MSLLLAGIDEAGYGPTLGPLCVGMSLFRLRDWEPGQEAPDLWKLLKRGVCRKPADRRKRVPIADSKQLKLANDNKTRHPLVHLERGVLGFLRDLMGAWPRTDAELFEKLGVELEERPWYSPGDAGLPTALTEGELAVAASAVAGACEEAGLELVDLRCSIVPEGAFNRIVKETGSKAEATAMAVGGHLRRVMAAARDGVQVRIVCDQLGGRTQYEGVLSRELAGVSVRPLREDSARSRYAISETAIVQFMPEAESAHLPVALASMVAKYVRELSMARFNRYWCGRVPELKPTAGYNTDARRWLEDMRGVLQPAERAAMVRVV